MAGDSHASRFIIHVLSRDNLQLQHLIVCDEFFGANSVFMYKDWLKPTFLSVTLGSQGSVSPNGKFAANASLAVSSSYVVTITKIEGLIVPEGFSQLLIKFDDVEVERCSGTARHAAG